MLKKTLSFFSCLILHPLYFLVGDDCRPIPETLLQIGYDLVIEILWKNSLCFDCNNPIRSHMYTCYGSPVVHQTCAEVWSDLMTIFAMRATYDFTIFRLWTQKSFVKWPSVSGGEWMVIVIHSSVQHVGPGHTVYHHCCLNKDQGVISAGSNYVECLNIKLWCMYRMLMLWNA